MSEKMFTIMQSKDAGGHLQIPWRYVEPLRVQIEINHGQTLERLAERGGLVREEIVWAIRGGRYADLPFRAADMFEEWLVTQEARRLDKVLRAAEMAREALLAQWARYGPHINREAAEFIEARAEESMTRALAALNEALGTKP